MNPDKPSRLAGRMAVTMAMAALMTSPPLRKAEDMTEEERKQPPQPRFIPDRPRKLHKLRKPGPRSV